MNGNIIENGELVLDINEIKDGYFKAKIKNKSSRKFKLKVRGPDFEEVLYDLNNKCKYEIFPVQFGDGSYTIELYRNVFVTKYKNVGRVETTFTLPNPDAPFLHQNQYVNYSEETYVKLYKIIQQISYPYMASEKSKGNRRERYCREIIRYIGDIYKYKLTLLPKEGTLPNIDKCLKTKKGICQDFAALAVALMRLLEIPAKLVIGYADGHYHAWVVAHIYNEELIFDPTVAVTKQKPIETYIAERWY